MKQIILVIFISFFSCSKKNSSEIHTGLSRNKSDKDFHKLEKLFITGDFDGDKKNDTIYQHNYSNLEKKEIDFAPNPMKVDWDEVVKWFYNQEADITLTLNRKNSDILHLGTGQGLYCLINIGDINKDGNEEIAFVIDKCDYSRTNNCKIYSLCNEKWQLLKEFGIREDAFDWKKGETQLRFISIKGYLEKRYNKWKYMDENKIEYNSPIKQMKTLKLDKCK